MPTLLKICTAIAALAFAVLCVATAMTIHALPAQVSIERAALTKAIHVEVLQILAEERYQSGHIQTDLLAPAIKDANARTGEALAIVRSIPPLVDARLASVQSTADTRLSSMQFSLEGRADKFEAFMNDPATGLIPPALNIIRIVNQVAKDHLVEKGNHASWPADVSGLLRSLELTMGSIEKAAKVASEEAPKMTADVDAIAGDVKREADQLTAPKGFWGEVKSWLLIVARVYAAVY